MAFYLFAIATIGFSVIAFVCVLKVHASRVYVAGILLGEEEHGNANGSVLINGEHANVSASAQEPDLVGEPPNFVEHASAIDSNNAEAPRSPIQAFVQTPSVSLEARSANVSFPNTPPSKRKITATGEGAGGGYVPEHPPPRQTTPKPRLNGSDDSPGSV